MSNILQYASTLRVIDATATQIGDVVRILYEEPTPTPTPTPEGSIEIILYKNSAEIHRVDKTDFITLVNRLSGVLRDECSFTTPILTIQLDYIPNFNYVYIPSFSRYYYVTDIVSVRKNLWEISLSVDVLMTYKDGIRNLSAFVDRNESTYNPLLIDKKRIIEQGVEIENVEIDNEVFINPYDIGEETPLNLMFVLNGYKIDAVPNV